MEFIGTPMESSAYFRSWFQTAEHDLCSSPRSSKHFLNWDLARQISPCSVGLFAACRFSLIGYMEGWLDDGTIPLGLTNCSGENVITLAALSGSTTTCETLLRHGFPINSGFERHVSPVDPSHARRSSIDSVDIVNSQDQQWLANGFGECFGSALAAAAATGRIEIVELLLEEGADVDLQAGYHGTALAAAALHCQWEVISLLIRRGADVDLQLGAGEFRNALEAVGASGSIMIINHLLMHDAALDEDTF